MRVGTSHFVSLRMGQVGVLSLHGYLLIEFFYMINVDKLYLNHQYKNV